MDFKTILSNVDTHTKEVTEWCDSIYNEKFASLFSGVRELFTRMQSETKPITDDELVWTLSELPLQLFSISESVQQLKLAQEVTKLQAKEAKDTINREVSDEADVLGIKMTAAEKSDRVSAKMVNYELIISAYGSIINRVESELSYSREFIMGAKKIWDARRKTELVSPIGNDVPTPQVEIPMYSEVQYN